MPQCRHGKRRVYWRPACGVLLEAAFGGGIGILASNPQDMRNARGVRSGFAGSCQAPQHIAEDIRTQKNRIERLPQLKGFKLPAFSTGALGTSGRSLPGVLRRI
jgi:hypothetical protein